ncbi:MAG: hypothetical protein Q8R79_07885 [Legionellaceae bacterium]|nr:hypothetical protein [Legionellaceae bacterium]
MFPQNSLCDLIVRGSKEELTARLTVLKKELPYSKDHPSEELGKVLESVIKEKIIDHLVVKNTKQKKLFFGRMFERCFELGFRIDDSSKDVYVVDEQNNRMSEDDMDDHVAALLWNITMVVPGFYQEDTDLMEFFEQKITEFSERAAASPRPSSAV